MKLISNKDIFQRVKVIIGSKKIKAVEDDPGYEFDFWSHFSRLNMLKYAPGSIFNLGQYSSLHQYLTVINILISKLFNKTTDTMSGENRLRSLFITLGYFIEELSLFFH